MAKGYKLTSAVGDGPKQCAFFFSDKGCRNGANCKFSHDPNASATTPNKGSSHHSVSSSSVMSSESESDGEIVENRAGAYASLANANVAKQVAPACDNPFAVPPTAPAKVTLKATEVEVATATTTTPQQQQQEQVQQQSEKKKKKRKKNSLTPGESIFDILPPGVIAPPPASLLVSSATNTTPSAAAAAAPPVKKQKATTPTKSQPTNNDAAATPKSASFRDLALPIASFSLPIPAATSNNNNNNNNTPTNRPPSPQHEPAPPHPPPLSSLPIATPSHLLWKPAVLATRSHPNYENAFNFPRVQQTEFATGLSSPRHWITSRPYGPWCASNPAAIAIDCEMCETKDPVTGTQDNKALCRLSIVNAENPSEVLLDTLVKPEWPVSNHRTWVNGITAKDLESVQFTLRHAQMFMNALCSDQTVIVGHAVHNDLMALRMVHHCNADTAMLFRHEDTENDGTPSLKNLAYGVLKRREMPNVHDSVNDARVALECAMHYRERKGKVESVEKVFTRSSSRGAGAGRSESGDTSTLLVHRLPTSTEASHICDMFLAYTYIKPKNVQEITFSGAHGKCHVDFTSREHADLAYDTLVGEEREDKTGKKQKRVGLKNGGYVCVRKMKKGK